MQMKVMNGIELKNIY